MNVAMMNSAADAQIVMDGLDVFMGVVAKRVASVKK